MRHHQRSDGAAASGLFAILSDRSRHRAGVAELADAPDLGSGEETRGGSSPLARTSTPASAPVRILHGGALKTTVEPLEGNLRQADRHASPRTRSTRRSPTAYTKRRQAGPHPRLPQGQGAAARHRHATSAASTSSPTALEDARRGQLPAGAGRRGAAPDRPPGRRRARRPSSRARSTRSSAEVDVRPELDARPATGGT